jgi:TRAP-type uncharacterized transport system fused permease subunit
MNDRSVAPHAGARARGELCRARRRSDSLSGRSLQLVTAVALAFSAYQLTVAAFHPLSSLVTRSLHVGFLLTITFLLYPAFKACVDKLTRISIGDGVLAILAFALGTYHWIFEAELIQRSGDPSTADLVVGTALVVLVFEAARRLLGVALPIVCGRFPALRHVR